MVADKRKQLTQSQSIVQYWTELGAESVGARELEAIAGKLREEFGDGAAGPAAIARTLAEEGVALHHPEILELDTLWRKRQFDDLLPLDQLSFTTIEHASLTVEAIMNAGKRFEAASDSQQIQRLRSLVRHISQDLALIGNSRLGNNQRQAVAAEVAGWLTVWLQNPSIFENWLELRRNSDQFRQEFGK